jgi:hypothetical protein
MCKRKRHKYKVGDMIEEWWEDDDGKHQIEYLMITGLTHTARWSMTFRHGHATKVKYKEIGIYQVLNISTNVSESWEQNSIDMKDWRNSSMGFRKV